MNYLEQIDLDQLTDSDMELLDVEKVAELCDVSIPTIYRKVRLGQFPAPTRQGSGNTRWMRCQIRAYKRELLREAMALDETIQRKVAQENTTGAPSCPA